MDKREKIIPKAGRWYTFEERKEIIEEYLTGSATKTEVWLKYTGDPQEHGRLTRWMRQLGYLSGKISNRNQKETHVQPQQFPLTTVDSSDKQKDPQELLRRIKELEHQLEEAQLKAEGYKLMVEIAEKELKIPIRKKSGTK